MFGGKNSLINTTVSGNLAKTIPGNVGWFIKGCTVFDKACLPNQQIHPKAHIFSYIWLL